MNVVLRTCAALAAAATVTGAYVASGATLGGIRAAAVGGDTTPVASCVVDGLNVGMEVDGHLVVGVVLDVVDESCAGTTFEVTLSGPNGTTTGSELADGGGTVVVTFEPGILVRELEHVAVLATRGGTP